MQLRPFQSQKTDGSQSEIMRCGNTALMMLQATKSVSKAAPSKAAQTDRGTGIAASTLKGPVSNGSSSSKAAAAAGGSALASFLCRPAETGSRPGRSDLAVMRWRLCLMSSTHRAEKDIKLDIKPNMDDGNALQILQCYVD